MRVDEELDGAGADVAHRLGGLHRDLAHLRAHLGREDRRRRLLDHLLVAPLRAALALVEVDAVAVRCRRRPGSRRGAAGRGTSRGRPRRCRRRSAPRAAPRARPSRSPRRRSTRRMPLPPPPPAALSITGKPIFSAKARASSSVGNGAVAAGHHRHAGLHHVARGRGSSRPSRPSRSRAGR